MAAIVRILIVSGRPALTECLGTADMTCRSEHVASIEALKTALEESRCDIIICDAGEGRAASTAVLECRDELGEDIPVIVVCDGMPATDVADLMLAGVSDIVLADALSRLAPSVQRALSAAAIRRKERRAQASRRVKFEKLRKTADIFSAFMENVPEIITLKDPDSRFTYVNRAFESWHGVSFDQAIGKTISEINANSSTVFDTLDGDILASGEPIIRDLDQISPGGETRRLRMRKFPVFGADGNVIGVGNVATDITEMERREAEFREQQQRMRLVVNNLPIMIVYMDPDGHYKFVNQTACLWYDRPYEDIVGRSLSEIQTDEGNENLRQYLDQVEAGSNVRVQSRVKFPDGKTRDVDAIYLPHFGDDGDLLGYFAMVTDISDRVYSEQTLRRNEARFRHIYNRTPAMLHSATPNGRLINVSNFWLEMLGYDRAEVVGRKLEEFLTPEYQARERQISLADRIEQGGCKNVDYQFVRRDGTTVDVIVSAVPELDEDGEPSGVLAVLTDVTDRKVMEQQLLHSQKMDAIGQLTGGVAHDFNNLLTVILGNMQLLEKYLKDDETLMKRVDAVKETAQRGADLTRRLMTFSRRQEMHVCAVDLVEIVGGIGSLIDRMLGEKIRIETNLPRNLWSLTADPNQLENALINILLNSRDAMPDGGTINISGSNVSVTDGTLRAGDYVRFTITDTGCGMPAEIVQHMFEPFFTTKDVGRGTGLGLSMVHGFVTQAGGHIAAESDPGQGTTITIHLPRAEAREPAGQEQKPKDCASVAPANGRILVVEDEEAVRQIAVDVLSNAGYDVMEAANGPEALKALAEHGAVDLMFTDIRMPEGLSGIQLARMVNEQWPETQVLYSSGYFEESQEKEDRLPDDAILLSKPYETAELLQTVRQMLADKDKGQYALLAAG